MAVSSGGFNLKDLARNADSAEQYSAWHAAVTGSNCLSPVKNFNMADRLAFTKDRQLNLLWNDYVTLRDDGLHRLNRDVQSYNDKKFDVIEQCGVAVKLERLLREQSNLPKEERDGKGFLPGRGQALFVQLPNPRQNLESQVRCFSDWDTNKELNVPVDFSEEEANSVCGGPESEEHFYQVYDPKISRFMPFRPLHQDGVTYSMMKEILTPEALENLKNEEPGNQDAGEKALDIIRDRQEGLHSQILTHFQNLCQVESHGNETFTIRDCEIMSPSKSSAAIYAIGLLGIFAVGGMMALWASSRKEQPISLQDRVKQIAFAPKEERQNFLDKLDSALQSSGKMEQWKDDRLRLDAMLDGGKEGEWALLNPEFKAVLASCMNSSGTFDAMRSKLNQTF